jgi:hypothetical protein
LPVLFDLDERLRKKLLIFQVVFHQQKLQGFGIGHIV